MTAPTEPKSAVERLETLAADIESGMAAPLDRNDVRYHMTRYRSIIQSLRAIIEELKQRDEAVRDTIRLMDGAVASSRERDGLSTVFSSAIEDWAARLREAISE